MAWWPKESCTATFKVSVVLPLRAPTVPLSRPEVEKDIPTGRVPLTRFHVYPVPVPPLAWSWTLYDCPETASGNEVVVIARGL
jgi:hypothetical protein